MGFECRTIERRARLAGRHSEPDYHAAVRFPVAARRVAILAFVLVVVGCDPSPTPGPTTGITPTSPPSPAATDGPTASPAAPSEPIPSPTAAAQVPFPLAVVTGLTNLKSVISVAEVLALDTAGSLARPCEIDIVNPTPSRATSCIQASDIAAAIEANQDLIGLLPPALVEPATKVLSIRGHGPYGLFGADLFGDPEARALPYPISGTVGAGSSLDPALTLYDASQVWTMTSIGSLCSDRWAAQQAVTFGKGWDWVFGGGTARYKGPPIPNPNPPPGIDRHPIVRPVGSGNAGAVAEIQRRADIAIADHECPILPTSEWVPNDGTGPLSFAVPEAVVDEWTETLGLDAVYLAANHMSDRGVAGIRSTLRILDKHDLPRTGLGMNLDEALEPAFLDVADIKVAFVAFNDVGGVAKADQDTAGVAWITRPNIAEAIGRAREGGADVIMCDPQWWGGVEYHDDLLPKQIRQLGWFEAAGCDHVVGAGTHVAGPMLLRQNGADVRVVLASPGNYVFGQDFWQNTQEGVILEQTFVGPRLANVRMHPYVIILGARPALTDPEGDGGYVLERIFRNSELDYRP